VDEIVRDRGGPQLDQVIAARRARQAEVIDVRSDEIRAWWREGEPIETIAERLDLPVACVQRSIGDVINPLDRAHRNRAIVTRTRTRRYTDEELLAGIRTVAQQLGHTPTQEEYRGQIHQLGLASILTLAKRFGGWPESLVAAGLTPLPRARAHTARRRWDSEACWQALESVADQLGDPPRFQTYVMLSTGRDDLPSGPTVRNQLGRWIDIVIELASRRSGLAHAA
jgi:hypothetical protein